jgi:hypothetical protein
MWCQSITRLTFSGYHVKCPLLLSGISCIFTQTAKGTVFASLLNVIFENGIMVVWPVPVAVQSKA